MPNMPQAIIWTNVGPFHWRIYAALGGDELISPQLVQSFGRSWWRHQMETFSALLAICAGNSPVPGEFPTQRPVTRSFGVYLDLRPNQRLSKQSWGWWFETASRPLWRHRNIYICLYFHPQGWAYKIIQTYNIFTSNLTWYIYIYITMS